MLKTLRIAVIALLLAGTSALAQAICEFMLKESKPNDVVVINGIKSSGMADAN